MNRGRQLAKHRSTGLSWSSRIHGRFLSRRRFMSSCLRVPMSESRVLKQSERPTMTPPSLSDLLSVATEAAYIAGRRTLAYFNTGVAVERKADDTPVTRADRESERLIRDRITRSFPDHAILGEEGGARAGDPDYRWIIDPID